MLQSAVETCQPLAERRTRAHRLALPDEPLHVDADAMRLVQILGNLLTNTCHYTDPDGRISVVTREDARS